MSLDKTEEIDQKTQIDSLKEHIKKQKSPSRHSLMNAWEYIRKADMLFDIDKNMSAFCAITAEEEAATGLLKLIKERRYPDSDRLQPNQHPHKVAVFFVLKALWLHLSRPGGAIHTIQVTGYDQEKLQLRGFTNFLPQGLFIVFDPLPLNLVATDPNGQPYNYQPQVDELTSKTESGKLSKHIKSEANDRNLILYADQNGLPSVEMKETFIRVREKRVEIISHLYVLIAQHKEQQPLVESFTKVFARLIQSVKNNE